jgi:uncharacterized protein (DUF58 family)
MLRPIYIIYRLISGARYRMNRRFTRPGLAILGGLIVVGAMGVDTDNTVAYQAFALLLAMLAVAVAVSLNFRARFSAVRSLPRFGTAGLPLTYSVSIRNLTRKTQAGITLLEDLRDPRPSYADWLTMKLDEQRHVRPFRMSRYRLTNPFKIVEVTEAAVSPMLPNQEVNVRVELTPLRRGLVQFKGVSFARSDPLGLFRSFVKSSLPQAMVVLPRRYPLPPIALPGVMKYQQGGVALASNIGRSDEFVALRDYRRGDPVRHIHWRSWAKAGKPIVKEFEDEFFMRHALILDTFTQRPYSDEFEEAVSVAASFACTVVTQESLLDLLFVGPQAYCFTAGRGLAHSDQMLEILASVRPCADKAFGALEHLVVDHVGVVSGCICVLLAWDPERMELVRKLRALGLPVLVLIVRRPGDTRSLEPGPMQDQPDRLHSLEVGQIEEGLARLA